MDEDDFEGWKVCWMTNLNFYETISKPLKCIVCDETYSYPQNTRRSCFWFEGTRCSAGHSQAVRSETEETSSPGVCATCDLNFMFDVVKSRRICRREGCRRVVRVHQAQVMNRLAHDQDLFE